MVARLRPVLLLAGVAASMALTYLAFRDIDFGAFVDALTEGDPLWYAASFVVLLIAYADRIVRWWVLFAREARPPLRPLVRALIVS